uniref:Uncharacterized protein n=1 Tax=Lepeophtheirus salmonis TaxID=72036 RepID=A0A0K2UEP5_LEPSM
MFLLLVILYM